jgi:cytochrome P450
MTAANEIADFDPFDPASAASVIDRLGEIRQRSPVTRINLHGGVWLVTGYEAARTVLGDYRTYVSSDGIVFPPSPKQPDPPIETDPPLHREFRTLLNPYFSRAGLAAHEDTILAIANDAATSATASGRCEIVSDLATPIAVASLIRVTFDLREDTDEDLMRQASAAVSRFGQKFSIEAWQALQDCIARVMQNRRESGIERDDALSAILNGTVAGRPLTEDERLGVVSVIFSGGLDTTRGAITSMIYRMTQQPELEHRLRDPASLRADLDEFLRLDSPVSMLARHVTADTELCGQRLRAGEWVLVCFGAANRDGAVFANPAELDLDRESNRHIAFGSGVHRCIGLHVARLQIEAAMAAFLSRAANVRRADGSAVQWLGGFSRRIAALPVEFDRLRPD